MEIRHLTSYNQGHKIHVSINEPYANWNLWQKQHDKKSVPGFLDQDISEARKNNAKSNQFAELHAVYEAHLKKINSVILQNINITRLLVGSQWINHSFDFVGTPKMWQCGRKSNIQMGSNQGISLLWISFNILQCPIYQYIEHRHLTTASQRTTGVWQACRANMAN